MLLRTRLTLVLSLAVGVLLLTLAGMLALWRSMEHERYDRLVIDTQRVNWERFSASAVHRVLAASAELAHDALFVDALERRDVAAIRARVLAHPQSDLRLDVLNDEGGMAYTSATTFEEELQIDLGAVRRVLTSSAVVTGIAPTGRDAFSFVAAVPVKRGADVTGAIVLSLDADSVLLQLSQAIAAPVAIVNLRGRPIVGNGAGLLNQINPLIALRKPRATAAELDGKVYGVVAIPLMGYDRRQVGSFVSLRDVSSERAGEVRWLVGGGSIAFVLAGLILATLFVHMRQAFAPLGRAVDVLTALSRGDTRVRFDAVRLDEAGQIADGIGRLRGELINLETLREERERERRRQEVIIRDELRELAGTLDDASRDEILADLQAAHVSPREAGAGHQLGALAFILGRLSGRIRDQHQRLRKLIDDLNEALRTKEAFVALQQELEIARRMQLSVLPRSFPTREDVSLATFILPAKEVGGDFYDYFLLEGGRIGVVIADVSGKGVPAAFFMAICRTLLKVSARFVDSPAETLSRVNNLLAAENEEMMFVTLFYGVLDPASGRFVYASGGHTPPVLRSAGEARFLRGKGGMALAVAEDAPFSEGALILRPGDVLFLYTDGVTEAQDPDNALFGETAMLETIRRLPENAAADAYPRSVVDAVQRFARGAPQADDITCVTVRYAGHPT